ncbi:adenosine deaminase [Sneathiella sp. P13V-1]|uniref:adenosine deaminase n=1 Tax=Sneathiella sp. P13V-1 TaxID=2697366 RepID=UPI00187B5190|nr:adenosine deaminase [Sneathiella sp. P13V-1]MBE7638164.1 adenosine deaminase [Sneathiella sp. P13V-1]
MTDLTAFIEGLPKVELHLHIEGSLEPELMFDLAKRNNIDLPFKSVEEVRAAYEFTELQDFLDIYYQGMGVLQTEQDFYDLTDAYLKKIHSQNVIHTEIFFDPQGHTERGVAFETVINGITRALDDGCKNYGISSEVIMCFLRHLSEEDALKTLEEALPFKDRILGVGLDSSELGHPPSKFQRVFAKAKAEGLKLVAHAGEEGPPEYVTEALDLLKIDRLDHGNRSLENEVLTKRLADMGIALTVCPLSNYKLAGVTDMTKHPLKTMLDKNLNATINSDDPAYFGGYMTENYLAVYEALDLSREELETLAENGINASFCSEARKTEMRKQLNSYVSQ